MYTIATHDRSFHSDDVLAVASLQLLLGKENINIIRTRDKQVLATADYVVDVGGVYDHDQKRYDHHQAGSPLRSNGIPYAAMGLVWLHYGVDICGSAVVAEMIEQSLCQPVDAGDNGISLYVKNDYKVSPFELYNVINSFVPYSSDGDFDAAFIQAVDFASALLKRLIAGGHAQQIAIDYVKQVYESSTDKSLLVFGNSVAKSLLIPYLQVKAIIYPSVEQGTEIWRASVIPESYGSFVNRVSFPATWAGLSDNELAKVSKIDDAIFCNKNLFLFAAKSRESAVVAAKMAK